MTALNFMPRDQWAKSQVTPSSEIADYLTQAEIKMLRANLVARFKQAHGEHAEDIRFIRASVRAAIKRIDRGLLPSFTDNATADLLMSLRTKYEEATKQAYDGVAADKQAWTKELQRRADLQSRYAQRETQ